MALPLPDLDDRRWADLVEDGRALIPLHAPDWTDHNVHDPGITLIELLAWVTEADLYAINRVPDAHSRAFLELLGIRRVPPEPAHVAVSFARRETVSRADPLHLPAATEVGGADARGLRFRTVEPVDVQPGRLRTIQSAAGSAFRDHAVPWRRGEPVALFGSDPRPGDGLYLGFDAPIAPGGRLSLYLQLDRDADDPRSDDAERRRVIEELRAAAAPCPPGPGRCGMESHEGSGQPRVHADSAPSLTEPLRHHAARLAWEYRTGPGAWRSFGRVRDGTRGFTLNGPIVLEAPGSGVSMGAGIVGASDEPLYWVRCLLESGGFDAPVLGSVMANAVRAEQALPVSSTWEVPDGVPQPAEIEPGAELRLDLAFEASPRLLPPGVQARLTRFAIATSPGAEQPAIRVLRYAPARESVPGVLEVEAAWLGRAEGVPNERFEFGSTQVLPHAVRLFTVVEGEWEEWRRRAEPFALRRGDRAYRLDPNDGVVRVGDGERGRMAPGGADVVAVFESTAGAAGGLPPGAVASISNSPHNQAAIPDLPTVRLALEASTPFAARGGADGESLSEALGRAFLAREARTRAVTLDDYSALALQTPGTRIARAATIADAHPDLPCHEAPGVVWVVVVPYLPADRPRPTPGLLSVVQTYLDRRRLVGTRVIVTGPAYRRVSVRAALRPLGSSDPTAIAGRAAAAVDALFDPLRGGPAGDGWPLGRDVHRSEVLQVLDETAGVDHVISLELTDGPNGPSCGNLCLEPNELVASGAHTIEVHP